MNWIIFAQLLAMGGGGTVQPGPGTGEYLERFDVYGSYSPRFTIDGAKVGRMDVFGSDSNSNE